MAQFDVHPNPIPAARRAYPYVVVLQSELADIGRERIVAPLAPSESFARTPGRLTPTVRIDSTQYVVLVPSLAGIASQELGNRVGSLAESRGPLLAAVDYLFFGV